MTLRLAESDLLLSKTYIAGHWVDADNGAKLEVTNPATAFSITTVPRCGQTETARAIAAAHEALPAWRTRTAAERVTCLRQLHALILANKDALARILTAEQGKPLAEANAEVASSAAYILWFAEEARRIYGDVVASPWPDRQVLVTREPVGVVAAITPV